ncbi:MAG: hypothetical protein LBJ59_08865 [Zoogloeaceae bacterium]|nr:hypothetical protein [Zoogloeaceae bacterium]
MSLLLSTPTEILGELERYLSNALRAGDLRLSNTHGDGRSNSSEDERSISSALRLFVHANPSFKARGLTIEIAPPRHWYDFLVCTGDKSVWLPVNVKVTAMRGQDNISSKEGLFYAVTGVRLEKVRLNTWERYCESTAKYLDPDTDADYYFLVVSKNNIGNVFWASLKKINQVVPNGNNPPFQCAWRDNQKRVDRPSRESISHLLNVLGETFRLRADAYLRFNETLALRLRDFDAS